jgi:hypothetical protein
VHVAVPGLPVVTGVVPQPVFVLHVTVPLTSCGFVPFLPDASRFFASPYSPSIVAVNVTDCPYWEGFTLEATDVLEVACVMVKLLVCELLDPL